MTIYQFTIIYTLQLPENFEILLLYGKFIRNYVHFNLLLMLVLDELINFILFMQCLFYVGQWVAAISKSSPH